LGEYLHNLADLPQLALWSPENSIPALISLLLFLSWWKSPYKYFSSGLFLNWGIIHFLGGIISVLPLSFLPFVPAQTPLHYFMHLIYALAQLPLIIALAREFTTHGESQKQAQ
jgi:hypothetical protein